MGRAAGERHHRGLAGGADALTADHFPDGEQKDARIEPEALVVDVPYVEAEFLLPGEGIAAVDLGPAAEAGHHVVAAGLLRGIQGQVLHQQGPGADEAHLAAQDVEQPRQFVDRGGPQPAAEGREPLGIGEQGAAAVAGVGHRAELQQPEGPAAVAGALLAEEGGGTEAPAHQKANQDKQWRQQRDKYKCKDSVEKRLEKKIKNFSGRNSA